MYARILGCGQHEELFDCVLFLGFNPTGEPSHQGFAQPIPLRYLFGFCAGADERLNLRDWQSRRRGGLDLPHLLAFDLFRFKDGVFQRVVHGYAEQHAPYGEYQFAIVSDMVELGFLYRILRHVCTTFLVVGNIFYSTPTSAFTVSYFTMFEKRVSYAGYRSCILWRVTHYS